VPGFSERVIYRELFLQGLTLLDLKKANFIKSLSVSHVAARHELRNFVDALELKHPPTH
jgi:chromosome partitioning protein